MWSSLINGALSVLAAIFRWKTAERELNQSPEMKKAAVANQEVAEEARETATLSGVVNARSEEQRSNALDELRKDLSDL